MLLSRSASSNSVSSSILSSSTGVDGGFGGVGLDGGRFDGDWLESSSEWSGVML